MYVEHITVQFVVSLLFHFLFFLFSQKMRGQHFSLKLQTFKSVLHLFNTLGWTAKVVGLTMASLSPTKPAQFVKKQCLRLFNQMFEQQRNRQLLTQNNTISNAHTYRHALNFEAI